MKTLLSAFAATTVIAGFATIAHAADLNPVEAPEVYRKFVTVKGGYGPSVIDNEFQGANVGPGEFRDDYIIGAAVEAGAFLTENIRISLQANIGRIEHEQIVNPNGPFVLEGDTRTFQGFAKLGYETRLADLGLTAPLFSRSSVFAVAGIGFTYLDTEALIPGNATITGSDTVLSGVVGFGSVYRLTDSIDFVSELNYTFGQDVDLKVQTVLPIEVETRALTSQIGLRFRF